ncbi:MAG: hypothetical protein PHG87_07275 [Candidatus Omnitrophica bacterium]|nr:hypothetical protein [Candidatus Omnitrophota bacterium]
MVETVSACDYLQSILAAIALLQEQQERGGKFEEYVEELHTIDDILMDIVGDLGL